MSSLSWSGLLTDARKARRLADSTVVVLGEPCKAQLLPVLPFVEREPPAPHALLTFASFPVEANEADDTATRVSVWSLGDVEFHALLEPVLRPQQLANAAFVIMLDMAKPWALMDQLHAWAAVIEEHTERLMAKLSMADRDDLRDRQRGYLRRRLSSAQATTADGAGAVGDDEHLPELPAEMLSGGNRGVPIVVVCCNCDDAEPNTSERRQRERFVELSLRRWCLRHGAALVYSRAWATLDSTEIPGLLHQYLLHRLYPSRFAFEWDMGSPRAPGELFWPAGNDDPVLLAQAHGEITEFSPDAPFSDVVATPRSSTVAAGGSDGSRQTDRDLADESWLQQLQESQAQLIPAAAAKSAGDPSKARAVECKNPVDPLSSAPAANPKPNSSGEPSKNEMTNFWTGLLNKSPHKK